MRTYRLSLGGMALALTLFAPLPHAKAVVFDFTDKGEGAWATIFPAGYTEGGITVDATGIGDSSSTAYLDGPFGRTLLGGLGVCSTPPNAACADNTEGNLGRVQDSLFFLFEKLTLTFSTAVQLTNLTFLDRNHNPFDGSILINAALYNIAGGSLSPASLFGTTFDFIPDPSMILPAVYVGTITVEPVPVPAAAALFGSTFVIGSLLAWRRRRAAAQTC
jgi:hypothetical protein